MKAVDVPQDFSLRRMRDTSPGLQRSSPRQWRRGDIVEIKRYHSAKSHAYNGVWAEPEIQIILAVYNESLMAAPVREDDLSISITAMQVMPKRPHGRDMDASQNELFIRDTWSLPSASWVEIKQQSSLAFIHMMTKLDQLDPQSIAVLLQRNRIYHSMAYIPLKYQNDYFKAMTTREAVYQPEADGSAAEDFLVTTTGSFGPRDSWTSEAGDLLVNDLGLGLKRGKHDMKAAHRLLCWKPSLKYVLSSDSQDGNDWEYSPISSPEFPDFPPTLQIPSPAQPTPESPKNSRKMTDTHSANHGQQEIVRRTDGPSKHLRRPSRRLAATQKVARVTKTKKPTKRPPRPTRQVLLRAAKACKEP